MDRWYFLSEEPNPVNERQLCQQSGIRLYDGDNKTNIEDVTVELTTHRIIIRQHNLSLLLSRVGSVSKEDGIFLRSDKVILKLLPLSSSEAAVDRPYRKEKNGFIKISFRSGGHSEFQQHLNNALQEKLWTIVTKPAASTSAPVKREMRAGITGIEKNLNQKARRDDANISKAFEDLNKLIEMAKPMVKLAQSISTKIREKQGEITEDETVQFKSYLLSLGIDDPITKGGHSESEYYKLLAKEMFHILDQPIQQSGGMMTLTDAFVRVNRARGLELVSPDDILLAARALKDTHIPMRLHQFESGVLVLMTSNNSEEEIRQDLMNQLESVGSFTAEEMSRQMSVSVILSRERLLSAESDGLLCRDDSVEGLRFYPNKFLTATS